MEGHNIKDVGLFLTVASANTINGFSNSFPAVINLFNEHKLDFLLLQETHRINLGKIQPYLNSHDLTLFGNAPSTEEADCHFKSGTAILSRNITNLHLQPSVQTVIPNRAQFFKFSISSATYLFVNIYMPSGKSHRRKQQRCQLLQSLEERIQEETYDFLFVAGDFNMVLCEIDATAPLVKSEDYFATKEFLRKNNLKDSFRHLHPRSKTYTYIRPNTSSRLDRIYLPEALQHKLLDATHMPLTFSDHSFGPLFRLKTDPTPRMAAAPIWKLNDSLLDKYTNHARFEWLLEKWLNKPLRFVDPILWWEKFKIETKHLFQRIGSFQSQNNRSSKEILHQELQGAKPEEVPSLLGKLRKLKNMTKMALLSVLDQKSQMMLKLQHDFSFNPKEICSKKH